jgi:hypothetical protein
VLTSSGVPVLFVIAAVFTNAPSAWSADDQVPALVRVRSNSPSIGALIPEATERSTVFRRLVETIDATDGLVYVDEGRCGHGVQACLTLSVQVAGPHRILRILVDPRRDKKDCGLMASIGHELWHAIEVLREPKVRDFSAAFWLFEREGPSAWGRFETPAAIRTGIAVLAEVCRR